MTSAVLWMPRKNLTTLSRLYCLGRLESLDMATLTRQADKIADSATGHLFTRKYEYSWLALAGRSEVPDSDRWRRHVREE